MNTYLVEHLRTTYSVSNAMTITVEYLPSSLNILANLESRQTVDSSEQILSQKLFQNLCLNLGAPAVDLFAS